MGLRRQDPAEIALVEETQAFLDGRYAELAASGDDTPVQVWAWMNLLAHGSEAELRIAASGLLAAEGWRQARAFVAGEVIDAIDAGLMSLDQVQRDILVPLELDVLSCQTADQWTPGQFVSGLLGVLPHRDTGPTDELVTVAVPHQPTTDTKGREMTLIRRTHRQPDLPAWFGTRPLFDWAELMGTEPELKVEEFREDGQLVVRAEMPGIDPDADVEITVSDDILNLRAERRSETKTEGKSGYRSEFHYGSFCRSLRLPAGATEADIKASYTDGILEVRIPIDTTTAEAKKISVSRG